MAERNPTDIVGKCSTQIGIVDQVVGSARVLPLFRWERHSLSSVKFPQEGLNGRPFGRLVWPGDLACGRRTIKFGPQVARNRVPPARFCLEPVELMPECSLGHRQVMHQDGSAQDESLGRGNRVIRAGNEIDHLPQCIEVGNIVDRKAREVLGNLTTESLRPLSEVDERRTKPLTACRVVILSLRCERLLPNIRELVAV